MISSSSNIEMAHPWCGVVEVLEMTETPPASSSERTLTVRANNTNTPSSHTAGLLSEITTTPTDMLQFNRGLSVYHGIDKVGTDLKSPNKKRP